jgi:hypothetical protein
MRHKRRLVQVFLNALASISLLFAISTGALAQDSNITPGTRSQAEIDRIVRAFTAKETEFRSALNDYVFKRDAVVQTIGMGGQVSGEYHRVSNFTFDNSGNRFEKINFFPLPTLVELTVTNEDLEDLGGIQPFALEASKIDQYNFKYIGKERIDELNLHVFDVTPKVMPDPKKTKERYFLGRIWVDDKDLQIVKVRGKGIPETKNNKYPTFDTYREQIDGRYWFPTYTYADEDMVFDSGQVVHIRMKVTYSEYKRARGTVRIIDAEGDEMSPDPPEKKDKPAPPPTKP